MVSIGWVDRHYSIKNCASARIGYYYYNKVAKLHH